MSWTISGRAGAPALRPGLRATCSSPRGAGSAPGACGSGLGAAGRCRPSVASRSARAARVPEWGARRVLRLDPASSRMKHNRRGTRRLLYLNDSETILSSSKGVSGSFPSHPVFRLSAGAEWSLHSNGGFK